MESVDQVGRRERFMQSNFESLSGGDEASLPSSMSNSISNAWRDGTGAAASAHQRNAGTIGKRRRTFWLRQELKESQSLYVRLVVCLSRL